MGKLRVQHVGHASRASSARDRAAGRQLSLVWEAGVWVLKSLDPAQGRISPENGEDRKDQGNESLQGDGGERERASYRDEETEQEAEGRRVLFRR